MIYNQILEELKEFELQRRFYRACSNFARNFAQLMQRVIEQIRKACINIGKMIFSRFFEYFEYVKYILFSRFLRLDVVYTQFSSILFYDFFNYDYLKLYGGTR